MKCRFAFINCLVFVLGACSVSRTTVPDPQLAIETYTKAAERGDADQIYDMLSSDSRKQISKAYFQKQIAENKPELVEQAKALREALKSLHVQAQMRFDDGAEATLSYAQSRFWVSTVGMLPGGSMTPQEALASLHRALKKRNYAALLRMLSPQLRVHVETQLRGLVQGLSEHSILSVQDDSETPPPIRLPNGHSVKLRRHQGLWYIDNFE